MITFLQYKKKSLSLYFVTNLFMVCLLFSCPAGGWNPLSVHSRWCMTTWRLWAMQTLCECSKKQPTPTSAVWFVSTAVSAQPRRPSLPVFIVRRCSASSGPSPLKTDLKVWKQAAAGFQTLSSCFHLFSSGAGACNIVVNQGFLTRTALHHVMWPPVGYHSLVVVKCYHIHLTSIQVSQET